MDAVGIGLVTSAVLSLLFILFFRFESKRGARLGERIRTHLDFIVLDIAHKIHTATQVYLKRFLKQFGHFIIHSLLAGILKLLRSFERNISHVMRINKTRANRAEKRSEERNKLEEIALHKLETTLTEEEKQKHRDAALRGE